MCWLEILIRPKCVRAQSDDNIFSLIFLYVEHEVRMCSTVRPNGDAQ